MRTREWQNYSTAHTYLFNIYFLFCLVLFYTLEYYYCFRFVCVFEFESLCLNNCKIKRSKQRTLFEFDVFAKRMKWDGNWHDNIVVSGTYIKFCAIRPSDEMAAALTLYRFGIRL